MIRYILSHIHTIISRLLWILVFVALGCSQRSCSCKRVEPIRQEIILTDRLVAGTQEKFPAGFITLLGMKNLLNISQEDTLLKRFKPNVALIRLDNATEMSNVQKLGMNEWQRFIRTIFTLSPDNYNPELETRFMTNIAGNALSDSSVVTDSVKRILIDIYLAHELQLPGRCRIYFYSADLSLNSYRCAIRPDDAAIQKLQSDKRFYQPSGRALKGLGCSAFDHGSSGRKIRINRLDTMFRVYHQIDCLNYMIAKESDSVTMSKSGCSVKDVVVKHIIIYEPPKMAKDSVVNPVNARPRESVSPKLPSVSSVPPAAPVPVKKVINSFPKVVEKKVSSGVPSASPIPRQPASQPHEKNGIFKSDSTRINQVRRQIINDFRELLFMFAKTGSPAEKQFFRTSALAKVREIPALKIDIIPQSDLPSWLDDTVFGGSSGSQPVVTPVLDKKTGVITGILIRQRDEK